MARRCCRTVRAKARCRLVGDERRLPRFRHPTADPDRLGARAMLVFCGRRHGLFANLTRFVYFRPPSRAEQQATADVAAVEARALALSRPGTALARIYEGLVSAYAARGQLGAERFHHQGGTCGYGSRDEVARPGLTSVIPSRGAVAWNPSLPGAKIEDTVLVSTGADEVLTVDPHWPAAMLEGRLRPEPWVR